MHTLMLLVLLSGMFLEVSAGPFGPPYPITASWFRDRFTYSEWNSTLEEFQKQGGDTVFLRAPPIIRRSRNDLAQDPNFAWCGSSNSSTGVDGSHCYDEALTELTSMGLKVAAMATYEYEEGFSDAIMLCPRVDRKINSSRIYYRIVLPSGSFNQSAPCDFASGSSVVVLFTSFAGTDPHALLLRAAAARNMSVYFGLPAAPQTTSQSASDSEQTDTFDNDLMAAYYGWVFRVVQEHQSRYSDLSVPADSNLTAQRLMTSSIQTRQALSATLEGYYITDECSLAQIDASSPYLAMYSQLGRMVHGLTGKRVAISPYVGLNRYLVNATVQQHVQGFETLARTGQIDIIAVQEGRGSGLGCYYWPTQRHTPISHVDSTLDRIARYRTPNLAPNITFDEAFTASNQELFAALEASRDGLVGAKGGQLELWLNVEAFEYLHDDPCLPVDPAASGMGELLNRASKNRVDHALTVASVRVQKVISFAWDSDYTCHTKQYATSLAAEIRAQIARPIIADCYFHTPNNRSVVVIGYNLEGIQQGFEINYPTRGKRRTDSVYGYYFELDWGVQHNRVPSLMYTQLYDVPYVLQLADKGWVSVKAKNAANECVFEYDFSHLRKTSKSTLSAV